MRRKFFFFFTRINRGGEPRSRVVRERRICQTVICQIANATLGAVFNLKSHRSFALPGAVFFNCTVLCFRFQIRPGHAQLGGHHSRVLRGDHRYLIDRSITLLCLDNLSFFSTSRTLLPPVNSSRLCTTNIEAARFSNARFFTLSIFKIRQLYLFFKRKKNENEIMQVNRTYVI